MQRHRGHLEVVDRRGCAGAGPKQHDFTHDTMKLLNGELAPEDWVPALGLIVALASVVFYGASKTHIYPVFFLGFV